MNRPILYIAAAALAVALSPSMAFAGCGSGDCAVGGAGTGGGQSDGSAQGFHVTGIDPEHGSMVTNSGNSTSGRLVVDSPTNGAGSVTGTIRGDTLRGKDTGFFGDCSGVCPDPFEDPTVP